jgi:prepilin-type N-terminal cleavage/methylation domain-containing protein
MRAFDANRRCSLRRGFTLVELLVVIAIIGVLVALLLPAVQAAREAARRASCTNNLKNTALAMLNYENARKEFPAPASYTGPTIQSPINQLRLQKTWAIEILPYMELQALFSRFNFGTSTSPIWLGGGVNAGNNEAIATEVSIFLCPSDKGNVDYFVSNAATGLKWARTNYLLNGSQVLPVPAVLNCLAGNSSCGSPNDKVLEWADFNIGFGDVGVPGRTIQRISDGTTNTIMLAETRVGLSQNDRRGVWAMGMCGSNFHCRHATNFSNGVNPCYGGEDDISGGPQLINELGKGTLQAECMLPSTYDASGQSAVRSVHPGGAFAALADGSVRFISDFIDGGNLGATGEYIGTNGVSDVSATVYRVWQRINVAADGMEFVMPQ